MLKVNLIAIGDIKEKFLKDAINEYAMRISRFANLKIVELKETIPASSNEKEIKSALKKDAENISKNLKGFVFCLDIDGKMLSSFEFANKISNTMLSYGEITFVIGASNGLDESIKKNANERISFSKMTFPHQLMRVIFLEQLYRSFTILNNIPYHK